MLSKYAEPNVTKNFVAGRIDHLVVRGKERVNIIVLRLDGVGVESVAER